MKKTPDHIVSNMYRQDAFSQWMGIEVLNTEAGYSQLRMTIREDMVNGFGICHGGITFSLADSALAFAANSHGTLSVALENNISFTRQVNIGDTLTAVTEEIQNGRTIGVYNIRITNQNNELVAEFRGTVFRTDKKH